MWHLHLTDGSAPVSGIVEVLGIWSIKSFLDCSPWLIFLYQLFPPLPFLSCHKVYSRHRPTIDPAKHQCGDCNGKLEFLGKFDRQGNRQQHKDGLSASHAKPGHQQSPMHGSASEGSGSAGKRGGTTSRGGPHAYRLFVKQNFAQVKGSQPPGRYLNSSCLCGHFYFLILLTRISSYISKKLAEILQDFGK